MRWESNRFRELTAIQEQNAQRGDLGFVIDTTDLSAKAVADAIWRNITEEVALVPYDPQWADQFEAEKQAISAALADRLVAIHHIGSTAIPGLAAKPVIDIMLVVRQLADFVACIAPLQNWVTRLSIIPRTSIASSFAKANRARIICTSWRRTTPNCAII